MILAQNAKQIVAGFALVYEQRFSEPASELDLPFEDSELLFGWREVAIEVEAAFADSDALWVAGERFEGG